MGVLVGQDCGLLEYISRGHKILLSEYGVKKTVLSDNGSQFASKESKAFASQSSAASTISQQAHVVHRVID